MRVHRPTVAVAITLLLTLVGAAGVALVAASKMGGGAFSVAVVAP